MNVNSMGIVAQSTKVAAQVKKDTWEEIKIDLLCGKSQLLTISYRNGKPYKIAVKSHCLNARCTNYPSDYRYFFEKDYFEYHISAEKEIGPRKMQVEEKETFKKELTDIYDNIKNNLKDQEGPVLNIREIENGNGIITPKKRSFILQTLDMVLKKL